jgi:hypothetical protein
MTSGISQCQWRQRNSPSVTQGGISHPSTVFRYPCIAFARRRSLIQSWAVLLQAAALPLPFGPRCHGISFTMKKRWHRPTTMDWQSHRRSREHAFRKAEPTGSFLAKMNSPVLRNSPKSGVNSKLMILLMRTLGR